MGMPGPGMGMPGPGMGMPGMPGPGMCGPGGCPPGMPGPGMGMPGGGMPGMVMPPGMQPGRPGVSQPGIPGAVAAVGALTGQPAPFADARTEVRFVGPAGMKIAWYAPRTDGRPGFSTQYLEAPARYNFLQASIYRLKLSDIPNRPGVDLYPTLEVPPATNKTAHVPGPQLGAAGLHRGGLRAGRRRQLRRQGHLPARSAVPGPGRDRPRRGGLVAPRAGRRPDPRGQAPRHDPAIIRLGNIDLEAPNTPAMDSPDTNQVRAYQQQVAAMQQMQAQQMAMMRAGHDSRPGMMPPGMNPGMMPPGMMPPGMMAPGASAPTVPAGPGRRPRPTRRPCRRRWCPATDAPPRPLGKLPAAGRRHARPRSSCRAAAG